MGETAEELQVDAAAQPAKQGRFSLAAFVAGCIVLVVLAARFYYGFRDLSDLGVLGSAAVPPLSDHGLTDAGRQLIVAGLHLALGVTGLAILAGLLLKRRRAWVAAMTWVSVSLALNLVLYFSGEPHYPRMLGGVIVMLVLNQAPVHRAFGVRRKQDERL